jgi:hypothetical protein
MHLDATARENEAREKKKAEAATLESEEVED